MTGNSKWYIFLMIAGLIWVGTGSLALAGPAELRAVVVMAAGVTPGQDKPESVHAITHATPEAVNTHAFVQELTNAMTKLNVSARVEDFARCPELKCLSSSTLGNRGVAVDILVFAGPAYFSKLPKQLVALFPSLRKVAAEMPDLVCSSMVSAWFPETKGVKAVAHAEEYFKEAGLRTVKGISLLTPRKEKPGVTQDAMKAAISAFAERVVKEARR